MTTTGAAPPRECPEPGRRRPAIKGTTIFLGPAERADVIVDFSTVAPGTNVILYNDARRPCPAFIRATTITPANPDLAGSGGAPQTQVGIGPNTRTIMQFRVVGPGPLPPFNLATLTAAWANIYMTSQPPPIVPQTYYPGAYRGVHTDTYASINATSLTYTPVGSTTSRHQDLRAEGHRRSVREVWEVERQPGV